jgi:APA family basic amino acid/polyamine antiporter
VAVLSVFVLRHRDPSTNRPFRALGYPWAPATFVIASAVMVINEIWHDPGTSLLGLVVMAAGFPLYWIFRRRAPVTTSSSG